MNPAVEAQAIDRSHRIDRPAPVNAYRLITPTVEEKIWESATEEVPPFPTCWREGFASNPHPTTSNTRGQRAVLRVCGGASDRREKSATAAFNGVGRITPIMVARLPRFGRRRCRLAFAAGLRGAGRESPGGRRRGRYRLLAPPPNIPVSRRFPAASGSSLRIGCRSNAL